MNVDAGRKTVARCRNFDVGVEDHGCFYLFGHFEYAAGGVQGFGLSPDQHFIRGLLGVFRGAEKLRDLDGKLCFVTHTHDRIEKVEPIFDAEGAPFDVAAWSATYAERHAQKVLVVHAHERGEGSSVLAVLPATDAGRAKAQKIRGPKKTNEAAVDQVSIDEVEVERP